MQLLVEVIYFNIIKLALKQIFDWYCSADMDTEQKKKQNHLTIMFSTVFPCSLLLYS